jgi:ribosomal protein S18 acetylase RimI-like enzyme
MPADYKIIQLKSSPKCRPAVDALAELHQICLPESMISRLGKLGAALAYRYFCSSAYEQVFVAVDGNDRIVGGTVVSKSPTTLPRRLAFSPMLTLFVFFVALWMLINRGKRPEYSKEILSNVSFEEADQEIISLMVASSDRRNGVANKLVEACFDQNEYQQRISICVYAPAENNGVLTFYRKMGFLEKGPVKSRGQLLNYLICYESSST